MTGRFTPFNGAVMLKGFRVIIDMRICQNKNVSILLPLIRCLRLQTGFDGTDVYKMERLFTVE